MNIPDEVAKKAYADFHATLGSGSTEPDFTHGFRVGAEWARKEALREAADAIEKLDGHFNWDEIHRVAPWLRSLAEGVSDGQQ